MGPLTAAAGALSKAGIIKSLLGPVAEAYGDDWGERARERLAQAKAERRQRNITEHLSRAEREVPSGDVDPAQLEIWLEGVADIDPSDKEMSNAWHAVLRAIVTGNPYRDRLIRVLNNITSDELIEFLRLPAAPMLTVPRRDRFVDLGLIRPIKENLTTTACGLMAVCLSWTYLLFATRYWQIAIEDMRPGTRTAILVLSAIGCIFSLAGITLVLATLPRKTSLGVQLKREYRKVASSALSVRGVKTDELKSRRSQAKAAKTT